MSRLPTVTALVAAYNYEQYVGRAVESALTQEYPPELLDVVVVDDGSKDRTAEVVRRIADRHPGRVELIQQPNGGATAALNRARQAAGGELLGLLDADDVWLPTKTIRQVELFQVRPSLSGVFCEMSVVDGDERVLRPLIGDEIPELQSKLRQTSPGQYAHLLWGNVATHSSVMVRAEVFDQVPSVIPYADWWMNLNAARISGIDFVSEPLALYRIHGANLTGGVSGTGLVREKLKEVFFRSWALRHLDLDSLTPSELKYVWEGGAERGALEVYQAGSSYYTHLVEVGDEERARSGEFLAAADEAHSRDDLHAEAVAVTKALAWNPYDAVTRARLMAVVAAAEALPARDLPPAGDPPSGRDQLPAHDPLSGVREFVVLADAEDLLADDEMLLAYGDAMVGLDSVSLAIDASRLDPSEAGPRLQALVERCGFDGREDIDLVAFAGAIDAAQRDRVTQLAAAVYRIGPEARESIAARIAEHGGVPTFDSASLARLRAMAESAAPTPSHG